MYLTTFFEKGDRVRLAPNAIRGDTLEERAAEARKVGTIIHESDKVMDFVRWDGEKREHRFLHMMSKGLLELVPSSGAPISKPSLRSISYQKISPEGV